MRELFWIVLSTWFVFALPTTEVRAAIYQIDLTQPGGVPGTAGEVAGPCYCDGGPLSSIYLFQPGDIVDFGHIVLGPQLLVSKYSPEPGQPTIAVAITSTVGVSFSENDRPSAGAVTFSCAFELGQCVNLPIVSTDLRFLIPDGAQSIQLSWFGPYTYTPPAFASAIPETSTWGMMIMGFVCVGAMAYRRRYQLTA